MHRFRDTHRTIRNVGGAFAFAMILGVLGSVAAQDAPDVEPAPAPATPSSPDTPPDVEMTFAVAIEQLIPGHPLLAGLQGTAAVRLTAVGAAQDEGAERHIEVHVDGLRWEGLLLGTLHVEVRTPVDATHSTVQLTLTGPVMDITASLEAPIDIVLGTREVGWLDGVTQGEVNIAIHQLKPLASAVGLPELDGAANVRLGMSGDITNPALQAKATTESLRWNGQEIGDIGLDAAHLDGVTSWVVGWVAESGAEARATASLPLTWDPRLLDLQWRDGDPLALEFSMEGLQADDILPFVWLPDGTAMDLDAQLSVRGALDDLTLEGAARGTMQTSEPAHAIDVVLSGSPTRQVLKASFGEMVRAELDLEWPLVAWRRQGASIADIGLAGTVQLAVPVAEIMPWLAVATESAQGQVSAAVDLSGTLGAPLLHGTLALEDAEVMVLALNRHLSNVRLDGTFTGDTLEIASLSAESVPGGFEGAGSLTWAQSGSGAWGDWQIGGAMQLSIERFPFVQEGFPVGTASGAIDLTVAMRPGDAEVQVLARDMEVELTDEELPQTHAIPDSAAVTLHEGDIGGRSTAIADGRTHVVVGLETPMAVRGPGLSLELEGEMQVTRTRDVIVVEGGFSPRPGGQFELFENTFEMRAGLVTLAQGVVGADLGEGNARRDPNAAPEAAALEPIVEVVAQGYVVDSYVLVKVHGPGRRPELVLASIPPVPEYQIVTLLVTGRVDAVDERNGNVRRQVAKLVERYHNPGLKRQLFDRLGVDNLGLGFGSSVTNPILTVGKQISRPLYVETVYHHSAPPDVNMMEGHVEYRLGSEWTFDTVFGEAAEGSVGVFWKTSFGGPPPPEPPADTWGLTDADRKLADDDDDGVSNAFDRCRYVAEDPDGFEDEDGCPDEDNDGDGFVDSEDAAPDAAEVFNGVDDDDGAPDAAPETLARFQVVVRNVAFESGDARVSADGEQVMRAVKNVFGTFEDVQLRIEGHSDNVGSERRRERVSMKRAESVRNYLIGDRLPETRIEVIGRGSEQPLDAQDTDEARALNRRVEVRVERVGDVVEVDGADAEPDADGVDADLGPDAVREER